MRRHRMILSSLGIGLLFFGVPWTDSISAYTDGKPLPGSDLTLRQAVEKADAIAIGRELHVLLGGGSAVAVYIVEATVTECLKGDLPPGKLRLNSIVVRQGEELPLPYDDKGKVDVYLFFTARWEKKGQRGHKVIKMLRAHAGQSQGRPESVAQSIVLPWAMVATESRITC